MAPVKVREEGFTVLSEGEAPIADLVFVHGLQGHPEKTWTYNQKDKEAKPAKPKHGVAKLFSRKKHAEDVNEPACSRESHLFWPNDLLAKDCPNTRVLTYGYDSHVSRFFSGPANQSGIVAHGTALMRALEVERRGYRKRPIIFLVHSLGGLILKQVLSGSKNALEDDQGLRDIYESTYAIIFFGTPHRGSQYAEMGVLARDIAIAAGFDARDTILRSLKPDAEILTILSRDFARMLYDKAFKIHSFQEGQGFTGNHFLSRKIVENYSSCLDDARESTDFINGNHMMMCRFRDADDEGYRKVKGAVSQYLDEICVARSGEGEERLKLHDAGAFEQFIPNYRFRYLLRNKMLLKREPNWTSTGPYLQKVEILRSLMTAHMNERVGEIETPHDYTFDWAFADSRTGFLEWLRSDGGLFWITGKPGSGKSTLMKYLLKDDRTKKALSENGRQILAISAFFFHARGAETEKSFDGLLRSIFYQLLSKVPELVDSVADIYREFDEQGLPCPWSLRQLETALDNLRQQDIKGCICLFIDALDEYSGRWEDIARFIKRLASPMDEANNEKLKFRVCASSRPETTFISLLKGTPAFTLQDWTKGDIERYASDRLKGCDRADTNVILEEITSKADGVFLWVKLVLDELWQPLCDGKSVEEARSLLSELPTDLPRFYKRMVEQIHAEYRPVLMAMLELVLCFDYRPYISIASFCLAIDILQKRGPVTPKDFSLTPAEDERRQREMERRIRACSGGLLEISSKSRVQFVHQTVKSFIQDAQNSLMFDGKSTRDMAMAGIQRMMRLATLLVGKMDSTRAWTGINRKWPFKDMTSSEKRREFDPFVIRDFISWELISECCFETANADLMHGFQVAMRTHCGENWLDTWWSSVDFPRRTLLCEENPWVRGSLKPSSFVEFAMQVELIAFVKCEVEKEISANPEYPRSPKLLYYTLVANALSLSHDEPNIYLYHSPESWQDFARFLLRNAFDANAMLEINIAPDRDKLMTACKRIELVFENVQEENTSDKNSNGTGGSEKASSVQSREDHEQGSEDDNNQIDNDGNDIGNNCIRCISIFHLALAIACTDGDREQVIYRLDMLRLLVEQGGNAGMPNYRNYWSRRGDVAAERSAIHYLLSLEFTNRNEDMLEALHKCITAFLNHGADPNAVDSNGISILELALSSCPYALVELILKNGAKVTPRLLLDSGAPRLDACSILNELHWRKPECYTPEARQIASKYNTHWPTLEEEEEQDLEPERVPPVDDGNVLGTIGEYFGNLATSVKRWASKLS